MQIKNNSKTPPFDKDLVREDEIKHHLEHITREFSDGFEFLRRYPKSVTVFGSARAKPETQDYQNANELGRRIALDTGYAVITGGGPGIMEAANKGAYESGGMSLGMNVSLPHERGSNAYVTHAIKFSYFFSRKTMLAFTAEAYVFFPGGFGTFDELFGILTLIQTDKIPHIPVILFGSEYWKPLEEFLRNFTADRYHAIERTDLAMFEITDSVDRAIEIIKRSPVSEWWRVIN